MDDVLTLVSYRYEKDSYGVDRPTPYTREIICQVESVTRMEFYDAGRNGLNPEFKFTVFAPDYRGETVCRFRGLQYSIYRTYYIPGTDYMELTVQREGGTNVSPDQSGSVVCGC